MAEDDGGWSFVSGFFLGAIIGGVAGILLAPKAGSETRAELREQSETWRARAEELAAKAREQLGPTMEGIRERVGPTVEGVRERVGPAVETVRERVGPAVETVREKVGPVADQVAARLGRGSTASDTDGGPGAEPGASEDGGAKEKKEA